MSLARLPLSRRALGLATALTSLALLAVGLLGSTAASAGVNAGPCPGFRVLHDDRIGPAVLPAGDYTIAFAPSTRLSCATAAQLFARFLEDYDGILPRPWRVVAEASGRASFKQGGLAGFSVARVGGGEGGNELLGKLCPGTYVVNANSIVGPLEYPKGPYLVYTPARSAISCNRASVLFTRFLAQPEGRLPFPWRLKNQISTFYKAEHPLRSAFRIEPLNGSGPA